MTEDLTCGKFQLTESENFEDFMKVTLMRNCPSIRRICFRISHIYLLSAYLAYRSWANFFLLGPLSGLLCYLIRNSCFTVFFEQVLRELAI